MIKQWLPDFGFDQRCLTRPLPLDSGLFRVGGYYALDGKERICYIAFVKDRKTILKISLMFLLFFSFQWSAQFGAGKLAAGASKLYLLLMYGGFVARAVVWIEILRDMKLISAYSISSLSYLIIPFMSWLALDESYKPSYLAGGILILAGISIFSVGEQKLQTAFPRESL